MRFAELHRSYQAKRLTQEEAAQVLGISDRTFRRQLVRYESGGLEALRDKRLHQVSHRRAPVDEVIALTTDYRDRHEGWNGRHFYSHYQRAGGTRSYSFVKQELQKKGCLVKSKGRGTHRKKRDRRPMAGMMIHQDASTHEWIKGHRWDLVATMDDATSEVYSLFFVAQEGTLSSLQGVQETIEKKGLFCTFYSDRGSHYWLTPEAGGKVDKNNLTQFGQVMKQLDIDMIAAYSPQARGRSERLFRTLQERLPKELALANIDSMAKANAFLKNTYIQQHNKEFAVAAQEPGCAFVPLIGQDLKQLLSCNTERVVGHDNCVRYHNLVLQLPRDQHRMHYVKAKVQVRAHIDGTLSIFYGPRCLAQYQANGLPISTPLAEVA